MHELDESNATNTQIEKRDGYKYGLHLGSKTVIKFYAPSTRKAPLAARISCTLTEKAIPHHLLLGSLDLSYPSSPTTVTSGLNAGSTSGFLRCMDDPESGVSDFHLLQNFLHDETEEDSIPFLVVPGPLGLTGREKLVDILKLNKFTSLSGTRLIFSNAEVLSLAFAHSSEGMQRLQQNEGSIILLAIEIGEDYACVSVVKLESLLPHDHTMIIDCTDGDHENSSLDSNVKEAQKEIPAEEIIIPAAVRSSLNFPTSIFPVERLSMTVLASEGHFGYGYQDMDEVLLQDWLAVLYHLAKSMKVKMPDTSWRLSKEALEGRLESGNVSGIGEEKNKEYVNVVEGFRWWVKLNPCNRSRCLQALSIFRMLNGKDKNLLGKTKATEFNQVLPQQSFSTQLAAAGSIDKQIEFLSDYLFDECDSILQSLTGWVSIQGGAILKQLLLQYGHEIITLDVKSTSLTSRHSSSHPQQKKLVIDGTRDIIHEEDTYSQNDTNSVAGTVFYDNYSRPMLRPHVSQMVNGLVNKLSILPNLSLDRDETGRIMLDSLLLWSEISVSETIGDNYIQHLIFDEIKKDIALQHRSDEADDKLPSAKDVIATYSCGMLFKEAFTDRCLAYDLPSCLLLNGLNYISDYLDQMSRPSKAACIKSSPIPTVYQHLSLSETVSTAAWCGNIGFALIYDEKERKIDEMLDISSENVIWLTDFQSRATRSHDNCPFIASYGKRLRNENHLIVDIRIQNAESNSTGRMSHTQHGELKIYRCHPETFESSVEEFYAILDKYKDSLSCYFSENLYPPKYIFGPSYHGESSSSTGYTMLHSDPTTDLYGTTTTHVQLMEHEHDHSSHARAIEAVNLDESLISSTSSQSTDPSQFVEHSNIFGTNHILHHEQIHRNNHSFYQRSNRHRREHAMKHHHVHSSSFYSSMSRQPSHNHSFMQNQSPPPHLGGPHFSSPSGNHHPQQYPEPVEKHWKLLLVRSPSFYSVMSSGQVIDSKDDTEETIPIRRERVTIVHENIHVLHAYDLQSALTGRETKFDQSLQSIAVHINSNGLVETVSRRPISMEEMLIRFPRPQVDDSPSIAVDETHEKEKIIDEIKRDILSLISPILPQIDEEPISSQEIQDPDQNNLNDERRTMATKRIQQSSPTASYSSPTSSTSGKKRLSNQSSRLATLIFSTFILLYFAFIMFLATKFIQAYWNRSLLQINRPSNIPPIHGFEKILEDGKINLNIHDDSDKEIPSMPPSSQQFSASYNQVIFSPLSPLARLRFTIRRIKGNIVETFVIVRSAVVNTVKRFSNPFIAHTNVKSSSSG